MAMTSSQSINFFRFLPRLDHAVNLQHFPAGLISGLLA